MYHLKYFITLSIFTILTVSDSLAQSAQYTNGAPVRIKSYTDVQGSAYFNDNWSIGIVKTENNNVYNNVYLKYNELEDQIYYKSDDDKIMVFNDPIKEFTFISFKDIPKNDVLFRNGYPSVQNTNEKSYFEVLADGRTQFLKRIVTQITDSKEYNSATVNRSFVESSKYYLFLNGKLIVVKKDKKSILGILPDKQTELNIYISNNLLNLKDENNIVKLIEYYNSIN